MEKFKVTKQHFKNDEVLKIGYCQVQYLLQYHSPIAYSCGVYGWSCDYYKIDGIIISTGYSPIGRSLEYQTIQNYENKARAIICDNTIPYEKQKDEINKLLRELIKEYKKH